MVLVCFFIDFVLDSWFWSSGFPVFTSPSEFSNFFFHLFKLFSPIGFGFFFFPHKLLSPIRVFIRLSLIGVHMESRRRGHLFFFSASPWRHFFPRGFVNGYNRDSGLLFLSLVLHVIFLYCLSRVFGHLDFPGFPINRWVLCLERLLICNI